jgi:hypothetical protein
MLPAILAWPDWSVRIFHEVMIQSRIARSYRTNRRMKPINRLSLLRVFEGGAGDHTACEVHLANVPGPSPFAILLVHGAGGTIFSLKPIKSVSLLPCLKARAGDHRLTEAQKGGVPGPFLSWKIRSPEQKLRAPQAPGESVKSPGAVRPILGGDQWRPGASIV